MPPVFRATFEQIMAGVGRMMPGQSEADVRRVAEFIKQRNDADRTRWEQQHGANAQKPDVKEPARVQTAIDLRLIEVEIPSLAWRGWSFVRAVVPWMFGRRAPARLVAARRDRCTRGGEGGAPCKWMKQDGARLYCRACECPATRYAHLGNKTAMQSATCVLGFWPTLGQLEAGKMTPDEAGS
jgi:hypothetical protein